MPISIEYLDSSVREENPTLILGKNILLKIVEDTKKKNLLRNKLVKFVSIPGLCNDDVRSLIDSLVEREACLTAPSFFQALIQEREKIEDLEPVLDWFERIMAPLKESKFFKAIEKKISEEDKFVKELLLEQKDLLPDLMLRVGKIDKEQLRKYEKKLVALNKEIEKKTGLRILVSSTLFICPDCKVILGSPEISFKKCYSCNKKMNEENVERIPIYKIPDEIKNVWQSNLWFEAYFAKLLRKLGCKTWTSVHAMGVSGILHEVDVLAIKNGTVLICECKTGKVSRNNVFNFCTKVSDLKAHISILALIRELPEPETREFVKKDPAIIRLENMGKMKEVDILAHLKHRLSIKA